MNCIPCSRHSKRQSEQVPPCNTNAGNLMAPRFQHRLRLFPGVTLNLSRQGLNSISLGTQRASLNIPLSRRWSTETTAAVSIDKQRQTPGNTADQQTSEATIQEVMEALCGPRKPGDALWRQGLVQRVLDCEEAPRAVLEAALLIRSPEAVELHLRRACGNAATWQAAAEVLEAVRTVVAWTDDQGWSSCSE